MSGVVLIWSALTPRSKSPSKIRTSTASGGRAMKNSKVPSKVLGKLTKKVSPRVN